MQPLILPLKWDSDFFNLNIGKINNVAASHKITKKMLDKYNLIYIEHPNKKKCTELLNSDQFNITFTDQKTIYQKKIKGEPTLLNEKVSIYPLKSASKQLIALSIQAGSFSRFKLDENFKKDRYKKLYTQWIKNSVQKKSADILLVYGDYKNPQGFITLIFKDNLVQIGLIAVDNLEQNKGIGKDLIQAAEFFAKKNNFNTLQVITQTINENACMFYEKQGFKKQVLIYTHHHWKKHANTI